MPTKDRFLQAKFAISCFLRQSWPTKELVILDQSADDRLVEWLGALNNPQLKWHSLRGTREPLGAIRNHAVELARGAFVCVWDDDDLQHPARIELAMASMAATKSVASVLAREIFWAPMRRGIGVLPMRPHENSLLAARAIMPRYANVARKEDVATVSQILRQQSLLLIDLPELYVYVAHGQNTCDEGLFNAIWDQDATDRRQGSAKDATLALLRQAFPIEDYEAFLRGRAAIRV